MRVLITGADGFVGRYVLEELASGGHERIEFSGDLRDAEATRKLVEEARPEACIHLAAIAFVPQTWEDPAHAFEVNVNGTLNLLEAFRAIDSAAPILVVSSSEVYGREARETPLRETDDLRPSNPYAISKAAADRMALLYAARYGMKIMTARPNNHIGPGQAASFVISSFAQQLIRIAADPSDNIMRVGNLESRRDFIDVRDVARAYRLLIERGEAGEAYNIASGQLFAIQTVLDQISVILNVQPKIEINPDLFRPTDEQPRLDTRKIEDHVGWKPEIPLETTLRDIVDGLKEP
ncbi:MAG: GDP-mannose 4,6-dehydratase [Verrucomicrobiota bacterium]